MSKTKKRRKRQAKIDAALENLIAEETQRILDRIDAKTDLAIKAADELLAKFSKPNKT